MTLGSVMTLQYNNLYANSPYDAEISAGHNVTGTLNYWGPAACASIAGHIYDGSDLPGLGILKLCAQLVQPGAGGADARPPGAKPERR